jgi:hypothetical protein
LNHIANILKRYARYGTEEEIEERKKEEEERKKEEEKNAVEIVEPVVVGVEGELGNAPVREKEMSVIVPGAPSQGATP